MSILITEIKFVKIFIPRIHFLIKIKFSTRFLFYFDDYEKTQKILTADQPYYLLLL